jgi:hypothetical protein
MGTTTATTGKHKFAFHADTVSKFFDKSLRLGVPVTVTTTNKVYADVLPMERDTEVGRYKFRNGKNFWVDAADIRRYEFFEPVKEG